MKYPGLSEAIEAAGNVVTYSVAYMRMSSLKWTMERAVSTPPRKRGPRRSWSEKRAAKQAARDARIAGRLVRETLVEARLHKQPARTFTPRSRYTPQPKDTSPYHIARIRAAYCDEFVKTGVLNPELAAKLKAYADDQRKHRNEVKYAKASPAADASDATTVLGQGPRRT